MEQTGRCLCGAVSFTAQEVSDKLSACHCGMCRRWTGGPLFSAGAKDVTWQGENQIRVFQSSDWAERGFCSQCGSALFYRITAPGPHQGYLSLAYGTFDDPTGFTLEREWFIDKKPEAYTLAGERSTVTEAEALAMFAGDAE